jgi:hypothetical protein
MALMFAFQHEFELSMLPSNLYVILLKWSSFKIVSGDNAKIAAMASDWLKYWKSLKIFFRTPWME